MTQTEPRAGFPQHEHLAFTGMAKDIYPPPDAWPVLVISLPDAEVRRALIRERLAKLSVPFEYIDAIDGRSGLGVQYEGLLDRCGVKTSFWRDITDPEFACALSHMSVYRKIVEEDLPGAVVLEDDAIPKSEFKEFLDQRAYRAGHLIQLDHMDGEVWRFSKKWKLLDGIHIVAAAGNAGLSTGYSISQTGAAFILKHGLPLRRTADWPCDLTELPAMLAVPRLVDHPAVGHSDSAIEAARADAAARVRSSKQLSRFLSIAYWRRWTTKRMKRRIS